MPYKKEVLDIKGFPTNPKPTESKSIKKRKKVIAESLKTTRKNPYAVQ